MLNLKKWMTKVNDKLHGLTAVSFSPSANRTVTDADNAPDGITYCSSNIANIPENYVILMTTTISGYKLQLAYQMSATPNKLYMRKKTSGASGSWSAWRYASLTS